MHRVLALLLAASAMDGVVIAPSSVKIGSAGTAMSSSARGTATIDFASSAINICTTANIAVTPAAVDAEVVLGIPNAAAVAGSVFFAWVSATNTVTVRHCCTLAAACNPPSAVFSARVFNP